MNLGKAIEVYTDGGCNRQDNKAAIAFVILDNDQELIRYSRLLKNGNPVTNNIAELMAVISALRWIINNINYKATYYINTDSQYVVLGVNQWSKNWIKRNWKNSQNKPVANKELWKLLLEYQSILKTKYESKVVMQWVRGHKENVNYNVVVDELCTKELEKI